MHVAGALEERVSATALADCQAMRNQMENEVAEEVEQRSSFFDEICGGLVVGTVADCNCHL